ncbi:MAG TPA: M48 family metallopeptidase [Acidimicrobiales bacterium]|nr:M48 family metallopeptidase [Acidimicrobiales bacterium]
MTLFDLEDLLAPEPHDPGTPPGPTGLVPHAGPADVAAEPRPPVAGEGESGDGEAEGAASSAATAPEVEVRISKRRKKTSEAKWVGGRIVVSLPAHLSAENRQKTTDWLVERLLTRHQLQSGLDDDGLLARAIELSDRYLVGAHPVSVRWVTNQSARWGSCSYYSGHIRISHRLRVVPDWVLDSVLVHEVAHLTYPDHSPAFHKLAGAYPRHKEAGVFLAGYGLGLSNPSPGNSPD